MKKGKDLKAILKAAKIPKADTASRLSYESGLEKGYQIGHAEGFEEGRRVGHGEGAKVWAAMAAKTAKA